LSTNKFLSTNPEVPVNNITIATNLIIIPANPRIFKAIPFTSIKTPKMKIFLSKKIIPFQFNKKNTREITRRLVLENKGWVLRIYGE